MKKVKGNAIHHTATAANGSDLELSGLREAAAEWVKCSPEQARTTLAQLRHTIAAEGENWVKACCAGKGFAATHPLAAEEWVSGPYVTLRFTRLLQHSLAQLAKFGRIPLEKRLASPIQPLRVKVVPFDWADRLLFWRTKGELRLEPFVRFDTLSQKVAVSWQNPTPPRVCLVLGAGNISSIGALDVLTRVFLHRQAVLLKFNPVNEYLLPIFQRAFQPLLDRGIVALTSGDAGMASALTNHPAVDEIHLTGSSRTFEAIRYGGGQEGMRRKCERKPLNNKPISAELGNISPMIVLPGMWTERQLRFQAERIVTSLAYNAGFNCNATRLLILPRQWPQRDALMGEIRSILTGLPTRPAFYPGAGETHARWLARHPNALQFVERLQPGHLPWTLIEDLNPEQPDEPFFQEEPFCSLFATTSLEGEDAAGFLRRATTFVNQRLWGSLNLSILADPATLRSLRQSGDWNRCVDGLRYGTLAINCWAALGYAFGSTAWGAFPGHLDHDIQSGSGFVHNSFMVGPVQQCVLEMPFTSWPKPLWFVTHPDPLPMARALTDYEHRGGLWRLGRILWAGLRNGLRKRN